jgi:hypothetical protein
VRTLYANRYALAQRSELLSYVRPNDWRNLPESRERRAACPGRMIGLVPNAIKAAERDVDGFAKIVHIS